MTEITEKYLTLRGANNDIYFFQKRVSEKVANIIGTSFVKLSLRTKVLSEAYLNNIKVSDNRAKIVKIRNNLYEVKAKKIFDQGVFYKNIMNNDKAAILSFKSMIDNYPKSELVSDALIQIEYLEKKKIKE